MGRILPLLAVTAALAACATPPRTRPAAPIVDRRPQVSAPLHTPTGLEGVMGQSASIVTALFGTPGLEVREGPGRKLQFLGQACVLDAYLYPPRRGGEPVVTHIDARAPDGRDTDKAACIAALSRR